MLDTEIKVTPELAAEHGLTAEEYARIQKILGREPNFTELGIFSVMWSEHCSYKSSKAHLRRLPTRAPQVLQGPGENAGVVDIGDGLAAAFKMESHNHPSYVEPFQGAATGVGGILRDIFTMGARPIAVLDSLRFGPIASGAKAPEKDLRSGGLKPAPPKNASHQNAPNDFIDEETIARNRRILDGVVRGIAHYGNCFGVPTVGGEVQFEPGYSANPLVNVLALGIAKKEDLFFAKARGAGNPVIYVGAKTGRDGIHGASLLASAEFSEESQQKRPNVQVGDPFMEKLLLERIRSHHVIVLLPNPMLGGDRRSGQQFAKIFRDVRACGTEFDKALIRARRRFFERALVNRSFFCQRVGRNFRGDVAAMQHSHQATFGDAPDFHCVQAPLGEHGEDFLLAAAFSHQQHALL